MSTLKTTGLVLLLIFSPLAGQATSLYEEASYQELVNDVKAHKVGDSLTVLVIENTQAEATADLNTDKSAGLSVSGSNESSTESLNVEGTARYDNGGEASRSGKFLARLTVTVHEVLDTGELRVKGEHHIKINGEEQSILLSGNVRPIDINGDNTVLSSKLANAKIFYEGQGMLGNDEPGVITRFFRWLF